MTIFLIIHVYPNINYNKAVFGKYKFKQKYEGNFVLLIFQR